jgi:hypothetical protein
MTISSSFQDLRIWQQSMDLTVEIYRATSDFPRHELYGLTSQMRRRRFRYRAILPKERDIDRILSSFAFFFMPGDLFWSFRPRS